MKPIAIAILVTTFGCGLPLLDDDDDDGETVAVAELRANGQLCQRDADCSTGHCGTQYSSGERRCYGMKRANEACGDTFDCAGGLCVGNTFGGQLTCVDSVDRCRAHNVSFECTALVLELCTFTADYCPDSFDGAYHRDLDGCVLDFCEAASRPKRPGAIDCETRRAMLFAGQIECAP